MGKDLEERNRFGKQDGMFITLSKLYIIMEEVYSTDVCVPISNITECKICWRTSKRIWSSGSNGRSYGWWKFSCVLPYDPSKEMYKQIRAFNDVLIRKALDLEGTITGEHGVGLHKKEYLLEQHPDNIPVMKSIKRTLDPNNIMNPGKIFDLN